MKSSIRVIVFLLGALVSAQAGAWSEAVSDLKGFFYPGKVEKPAVVCIDNVKKVDVDIIDECYPGSTIIIKEDIDLGVFAKNLVDQCGGKGISSVMLKKYNNMQSFVAKAGTTIHIPTCNQADSLRILEPAQKAGPIVEKVSTVKNVKTNSKNNPWLWQHIGADPFGSRDFQLGLHKAGVEDSIIKKLYRLVRDSSYGVGCLKTGDTLLFMLSGEFEVKGVGDQVVVCAWKNVSAGYFLPAQIYTVDLGNGWARRFARPDICFNWCELPMIWIEVITRIEVEVVEEDTLSFYQEEEDLIITPPLEDDSIVAPPPPSSSGSGLFTRLNVWYLHDFPAYGPGRHGANSYGLKGDLLWQIRSKFALGMTGMVDGWDGETITDYFYAGFEAGAGPLAIISFSPNFHLGIEFMIGSEWNWGWDNWSDYFQTNGFMRPGLTFDAVGNNFLHLSMWGSYKHSFAEKKDSRVNGIQQFLGEPGAAPNVRDGIDGGARLYFGEYWKVCPLLVWRESYAVDDGAVSTTVGCGVRFWDKRAVFETSFKNKSNSKYKESNGNAIELLLNLTFGKRSW